MKRRIRTQLYATMLVATVALGVILVSGSAVDSRVDRELETIRTRFVPKLGLANRLEMGFDKVAHTLRDAAEGGDSQRIAEAAQLKTRLLAQLVAAEDLIDRPVLEQVRAAIEAYYLRAEAVTRRKIQGETGGALARDVEVMQRDEMTTLGLLEQAARVDEAALAGQFESVTAVQQRGARARLLVSLVGLVLVIGLSVWVNRRLIRGVTKLAAGFRRFGAGDLTTPIAVTSSDEISQLARDANAMAARLHDADWVKAGQVGLAEELRGELETADVARRAVSFVAGYVGAERGVLSVAGKPLAAVGAETSEAPSVRVPLRHSALEIGELELRVERWTPAEQELLETTSETIAIALEVARGRDEMRSLLAESQRQAAELLVARRTMEHKAEELARASTVKSQFLANMSHELRTPLNAIIGFSELLADHAVPRDSAQATEFLHDILLSGRHLLQLINDVLDLSKVEAGRIELRPQPITLSSVIHEVLAIQRTVAVQKRIAIETAIDPEIDAVTLDPARLKQVLYNYLSNALKFTPEGGTVWVRALPATLPGTFRLEVEDTGPGIPEHERGGLFVEFQQTALGLKTGMGTGLGLALTKRLVEAQGGSVGVTTAVDKGSMFFAELPRTMEGSAPIAMPIAPAPLPTEGTPTVLVVEDEPGEREGLARVLASAGYEVEAVATGAEAVARGRARRYDAITLDLWLPDMTGLAVLQQLRETANRDVPVVLITIVADRCAAAGLVVHDILPKPLDEAALVATLARAGVTGHEEVLVVDDDPVALKVISTMLGQLGHAAHCETDPLAGLARARSLRPRAIILDLLMPELGGLEFLDRLRDEPDGREIPVIIWTAKELTVAEHAAVRRLAGVVVPKGDDGNARVLAELTSLVPPTQGVA